MTRLSKGLVGIATSQETLISGGSGDGLETLGGRKGATGSQPRWATSSFRPMEHGRCLGGPTGKDPRVPPLHCGAVRDRGAAGLGPSVVSFPRAPSAGEPGLRGSPCARLVASAPRAATSSAHPGDQRPARALGRRAVCAPARCAATLGAAGGPVRFSPLHCCLACRGRGSAPEGARAAGQQRLDSNARVPVLPCPGAGCAGRALPRAPSGKAFVDALDQASGAPPVPSRSAPFLALLLALGPVGATHCPRGSQTPWGPTVSCRGPAAEPRTMCSTSPGPQFPSLS